MEAAEAGRRLMRKRESAVSGKVSPRYAAVAVSRSAKSSGESQVMIFDTLTSSVVGNKVYDLPRQPEKHEPFVFETYTAEYVGNGW